MKNIGFMVLGLLFAQVALADTLTCYSARSLNPNARPSFVATIVSDSRLEDVKFAKWMKTSSTGLENYSVLKGRINESNHSPYRGAMDFELPNGDTLYLPADLSSANLKKTLKKGIGMGKNENGVIIGAAKDWNEGSGNHYSYRLRCESDR